MRRLLFPVLFALALVTGWALPMPDLPAAGAVTSAEVAPEWAVEVFEDGSGYVLHQGERVQEVGSEFFPWDCTDNGNTECGPDAPPSVVGFSCTEWVMDRFDTTLHYCTDGDLDWWQATDVDAEGEVL